MPYIPHTPEETQQMLAAVGVRTLEDLFADIPAAMRPQSFHVPAGLTEMEVCERLEGIAAKNHTDVVSFLGGGFYDHHIPRAVDALTSRGEFLTAYTPYQAEVAQGTLQAIFEYQSAVCRLLEMDVANASVYDGGSALFEAAMMAIRHTKRQKIVVDEALNPIWRTMLSSYTSNLDMELVTVPHKDGRTDFTALHAAITHEDAPAAVLVQNPNFFGVVEDFTATFGLAKERGVLSVLSVYPVMQAVLKTPGEMGADIAVADGQALGMPLSFGGPYLGIMTCTKALARQMPGRIVGKTQELEPSPGEEPKVGYVLTLQAREQHIRRAKATSNICSNQALCALRSLVYLSLLGPEGLTRTAEFAMQNARLAYDKLCNIPGVKPLAPHSPFGNEFALTLPVNAYELADTLTARGFVPGFPVGRYYKGMDNVLLVACTEKHSAEQIGILAELVAGFIKKSV